MDIRGYEKNRRLPAQRISDEYEYGYGMNIYLVSRVRVLTRVDIPTPNKCWRNVYIRFRKRKKSYSQQGLIQLSIKHFYKFIK